MVAVAFRVAGETVGQGTAQEMCFTSFFFLLFFFFTIFLKSLLSERGAIKRGD